MSITQSEHVKAAKDNVKRPEGLQLELGPQDSKLLSYCTKIYDCHHRGEDNLIIRMAQCIAPLPFVQGRARATSCQLGRGENWSLGSASGVGFSDKKIFLLEESFISRPAHRAQLLGGGEDMGGLEDTLWEVGGRLDYGKNEGGGVPGGC